MPYSNPLDWKLKKSVITAESLLTIYGSLKIAITGRVITMKDGCVNDANPKGKANDTRTGRLSATPIGAE